MAAKICLSAEQLRPTSVDSELSSFHEDHPEAQFNIVSIVPTTPVTIVQGGRSVDPSTPVAVLSRTDSLYWKSLVPVEDWC